MINILSREKETFSETNWKGVNRLIMHLNSTKELNLVISTDEQTILVIYTNVDWACDMKKRRLTTGNLVLPSKSKKSI